mmetsp:Transcript_26613/g.66880  ORF Transcript_26613/g.66880 Transcript_26613/m.66880 type:complete len:224 (-) Transcript_26613:2504-3175(-)
MWILDTAREHEVELEAKLLDELDDDQRTLEFDPLIYGHQLFFIILQNRINTAATKKKYTGWCDHRCGVQIHSADAAHELLEDHPTREERNLLGVHRVGMHRDASAVAQPERTAATVVRDRGQRARVDRADHRQQQTVVEGVHVVQRMLSWLTLAEGVRAAVVRHESDLGENAQELVAHGIDVAQRTEREVVARGEGGTATRSDPLSVGVQVGHVIATGSAGEA